MQEKFQHLCQNPLLAELAAGKEIVWLNDARAACGDVAQDGGIADAEARLLRFAPLIAHYFPETAEVGGLIESPLSPVFTLQQSFIADGEPLKGQLWLKRDSDLAVAGSVKARGGIHEVLLHTEELALAEGILSGTDDDYLKLTTQAARSFFAAHKMQVGSTGNLGLSIGIMSAVLGYEAIVHMSADAKQWKKELLRSYGVTVVEYEGDYGEAVAEGRRRSEADATSYFVDDENSRALFYGYAAAGNRLVRQFAEAGIRVDAEHPLFVYLPCGVGGAPGGIAYGLRAVFGDNVHCFFVEPVQAPCMTLGLISKLHNEISVQDIGLTGKTQADGLAVGRASGFIGRTIEPHLSGCLTVDDARLNEYLRRLWKSEGIFIEPSSCAAFIGPDVLTGSDAGKEYLKRHGIDAANITHLAWATGGRLVPEEIRRELLGEA